MRNISRASNVVRFTLIITALLLPTLSLVPLGGFYLWERGWLLWWTLGALLITSVVTAVQRWVLVDAVDQQAVPSASDAGSAVPDPSWNAAEEKAWSDVQAISIGVTPDIVSDPQSLLDLSHKTINAVARRLHPNKDDAIWQFTLPEALLIAERVSGRMNVFVTDNIPFGDRLTVSQFLAMYRWRTVVDVAERGYNIWRIIRLANPAAAATNEARERLSRALFQWGREQVTRRFAVAVVEEVGRAAIDLYGGRLKASLAPEMRGDRLFRSNFDTFAKGPLLPINVTVLGGTARDREAVKGQLLGAQRRHSAALSETTRKGSPLATDGVEIAVVASDGEKTLGKDGQPVAPDLSNSDALLVIVPAQIPLSSDVIQSLQRLDLAAGGNSGSLPPVLIPLIPRGALLDPGAEAMSATSAAEVRKLVASCYHGPVVSPVSIDLAEPAGASAGALWDALRSAAPHALRIQFVRHLERAKNRGGVINALGQAASAIGGLAKWAIWSK